MPGGVDRERARHLRRRARARLGAAGRDPLQSTSRSLHGASGLPDGDVRRAVAAGVAKVNVNTERERTFAMLDSRLEELSRGGGSPS